MEARSSRLTLLVEMGAERPEGQRDLVTLGAAGNRAWKQRGTLGVGLSHFCLVCFLFLVSFLFICIFCKFLFQKSLVWKI